MNQKKSKEAYRKLSRRYDWNIIADFSSKEEDWFFSFTLKKSKWNSATMMTWQKAHTPSFLQRRPYECQAILGHLCRSFVSKPDWRKGHKWFFFLFRLGLTFSNYLTLHTNYSTDLAKDGKQVNFNYIGMILICGFCPELNKFTFFLWMSLARALSFYIFLFRKHSCPADGVPIEAWPTMLSSWLYFSLFFSPPSTKLLLLSLLSTLSLSLTLSPSLILSLPPSPSLPSFHFPSGLSLLPLHPVPAPNHGAAFMFVSCLQWRK